LDSARDRRLAAKRHVRSVPVVVVDVPADEAQQMPLAERDNVVEKLAPQRADPPLRESVLPGRAGSPAQTQLGLKRRKGTIGLGRRRDAGH
jgi:hypothetical protein